ncbi:MAG: hypothetical protein M3227_05165 [Thermoproteota archaeon]|nr:hypothetical protein [Thermoproteota archaeon]
MTQGISSQETMPRKSNGEEEENEKPSKMTIKQISDLLKHAREIFKRHMIVR